jgi:membrane protease YdiL (CAAX protease family)
VDPEAPAPPIIVEPPPPDSATWRDLLIALPILWAFDLALGVALGVALVISGGSFELESVPWALLATTIVSNLFCAVVTWYCVCRRHHQRFKEGFALRHPGRKALMVAVAIGIVGGLTGTVLLVLYSTGQSFMARLASTPSGLVAVVLMALFVPPFEELYYRGFVFPVLKNGLGAGWSIAIVTAWFGFAHSFQLAGDWVGIPVVLTMGLIWTLLRHWRDSLVPSIVCHWTYNTTLAIAAVVSGA